MSSSNDPGAVARPPLPVAAAAFVSSFDRFAVSPLLILVAVDLGATLTQTLAIASTYYFAYGVSQPLWGLLSDRFGRLRLMRLTLLGAALMFGQPLIALFAILLGLFGYVVVEVEKT